MARLKSGEWHEVIETQSEIGVSLDYYLAQILIEILRKLEEMKEDIDYYVGGVR